MKYDMRLSAYVIEYQDLRKYTPEYINKFPYKLLIDMPNTKGVTSKFMNNFRNPNVLFHVRGGYSKERAEYWNKINRRKGCLGIDGVSYYEDTNIYSADEMKSFLNTFENIEKDINPKWNQFAKALYVYNRLREEIIYHPKFEQEQSYEIRTLRGLISKKTVCAGYAIIFKEMMDRLGIKCDYVEGHTDVKQKDCIYGNHAWNILTINGKDFPIDLTWDACEYRDGLKESYKFFANPELFAKKHTPSRLERLRDYSNLHGFRNLAVKKYNRFFDKDKVYTNSTFTIRNIDGNLLRVSQVGDYNLPNHKKVFRYVVSEIAKNGKNINYKMVYSGTSFLHIYRYYQNGTIKRSHPLVIGMSKLLSTYHMDQCLGQGSNYIGEIIKSNSSYTINRDSVACKELPVNFKNMIRSDGTHYLLSQETKPSFIEGHKVYTGSVAEFGNHGLEEFKITSEKSLLDNNSPFFRDKFLEPSRLRTKCKEYGGYVGYISSDGQIKKSNGLYNLFNTKYDESLEESDIVKPGCVDNTHSVEPISFDKIKRNVLDYDVSFDIKDGIFDMKNLKTGEDVTKFKERIEVAFSEIWLASAGNKSYDKEPRNGFNYAFNDGSHMVYDFLQTKCIDMMERNGKIDFSKLLSESENVPYKYGRQIVEKLVKIPGNRKVCEAFFGIQAVTFKDAATRNNFYRDAEKENPVLKMRKPDFQKVTNEVYPLSVRDSSKVKSELNAIMKDCSHNISQQNNNSNVRKAS